MPTPHLDYGLHILSKIFEQGGKSFINYSLLLPIPDWESLIHENPLMAFELDYNKDQEKRLGDDRLVQLNDCQCQIYNFVLSQLLRDSTKGQFFIHGPAGTGKTFLYKCICHYYRSQGKIVLCIASSKIAALLLPSGRTAHSCFSIPLEINEQSVYHIGKNTQLADLLHQTSLIIWDEVPMQHRYCFEAVNRKLNDISNTFENALFGNIPILLSGDFAQIAPIVPCGNRAATIRASLQSSFLWPHFQILHLTLNMRVQAGLNNIYFASWLHDISYKPMLIDILSLPSYIQAYTQPEDLIHFVYPTNILVNALQDIQVFANRCILAFHNDTVNQYNTAVLDKLPGEAQTFYSIDTSDANEEDPNFAQHPAEYLQSLNCSGLPPSRLILKVGSLVMLLRNLYPTEGLCNGTQIIVIRLGFRCIEVQILGGDFHGTKKLIPRILLATTDGELPFIL